MPIREGNKEGSDLSHFAFLRQERPIVSDVAGKAESADLEAALEQFREIAANLYTGRGEGDLKANRRNVAIGWQPFRRAI